MSDVRSVPNRLETVFETTYWDYRLNLIFRNNVRNNKSIKENIRKIFELLRHIYWNICEKTNEIEN